MRVKYAGKDRFSKRRKKRTIYFTRPVTADIPYCPYNAKLSLPPLLQKV